MAVLRRDLDGLLKNVKYSCDKYRTIDIGSGMAQTIKANIESFFERWYSVTQLANCSQNAAQRHFTALKRVS